MVINHVLVNTPSHMRQTIGLVSAASCASIADTCHLWPSSGPIFEAHWVTTPLNEINILRRESSRTHSCDLYSLCLVS